MAGIAEIVAWRTRVLFMLLVFMVATGLYLLFNELKGEFVEDKAWLFAGLFTALFVTMMGTIVYVSFFLRCPRCSTWTGMGVNKCASCGLRYDARESKP